MAEDNDEQPSSGRNSNSSTSSHSSRTDPIEIEQLSPPDPDPVVTPRSWRDQAGDRAGRAPRLNLAARTIPLPLTPPGPPPPGNQRPPGNQPPPPNQRPPPNQQGPPPNQQGPPNQPPANQQAGRNQQPQGFQQAAGDRRYGVYKKYGEPKERRDLKIGRIISMPYHHPEFVEEGPETFNRSLVNAGVFVFTKFRLFVIVACHKYHYTGLPIYTYSGNGLSNKLNRDEHVGIREFAHRNQAGQIQSQSKWPNIEATIKEMERGRENQNFDSISPDSYVHFHRPVTMQYQWPCFIEGDLQTKRDEDALQKLYYEECLKCRERDTPLTPHARLRGNLADPPTPPPSNRRPGDPDSDYDDAEDEENATYTGMYGNLGDAEA